MLRRLAWAALHAIRPSAPRAANFGKDPTVCLHAQHTLTSQTAKCAQTARLRASLATSGRIAARGLVHQTPIACRARQHSALAALPAPRPSAACVRSTPTESTAWRHALRTTTSRVATSALVSLRPHLTCVADSVWSLLSCSVLDFVLFSVFLRAELQRRWHFRRQLCL